MSQFERLDKLLVDKGLISSRERARAIILAGQVLVSDRVVDKPGTQVPPDAVIRLKTEDHPYVSRGGVKLAGALDHFPIDLSHRVAIDVGASTGGFTDCLLQKGVEKVYAVDVGYGQLAWKLRNDPRVVNLERTNVRHIAPGDLPEQPSLAVVDASFISLEKILPPLLPLLSPEAELIALIKPQFEVGKGEVGKGGVVKDPKKHEAVVQRIKDLAERLNCLVLGVVESSILGPKGNREFLIHMRCGRVD